jgi:hypothetical protein
VGVGAGRAERIESDRWPDRIDSEPRLDRLALVLDAPRIDGVPIRCEVSVSEGWFGVAAGVGVPGR